MSKNPHKKVRRPAATSRANVGKAQTAPDRWVAILALLGMLLTAYLTFTALSDGLPAFCTQDSSCDLIQHSRWSRIFGVPLALWGFALYAVLAFSAWRLPAKLQRWARLWLVALVGLAISLYMTLIGWLELDAFCIWCLLSLALLAAIFIRLSLAPTKILSLSDWRHWLIRGGLAALIAVASLHLYYSDLLAPREDPRTQALATWNAAARSSMVPSGARPARNKSVYSGLPPSACRMSNALRMAKKACWFVLVSMPRSKVIQPG